MKTIASQILIVGFFTLSFNTGLMAFVNVQPVTVEIFEPAGKKVSGVFTVKNPMDQDVDVEVSPEAFNGATGMALMPFTGWLKLSKSKPFKLKPNQIEYVKYKVTVPRDLTGETMVMVFFKVHMVEPTMGGVTVERKSGVPIYVMAKMSETLGLETKEVSARFSKSGAESPIEFSINVQNSGNVHLRPRGFVQISKEGMPIEEAKMDYGFPVYPTAAHQYTAHSAGSSWEPGLYDAKFVVYFGDEYGKKSQREKPFKFKIDGDGKIELIN